MCKKAYIYINYKNIVVLHDYLDVLKKALELNGYECKYVKKIDKLNKKALFIFPMGTDAFKFYLKGYRNYIIWLQGATADESYLRNHSMLRYRVLNYIDCFALKKAKIIFFCSEYMKKHYEKKSKKNFDEKCYIMPCYNEKINYEVIRNKDYSKKIFTYVGSLDLWQCFDEIVESYKKIEDIYPDAQLKVLTFSVEEAKRKLKDKQVKNYVVKCVEKEDVQNELQDAVYGFIIRKDSIINRVATPTKFSSYLSAGVLPIYSNCLRDFYERTSGKIGFALDENIKFDSLMKFIDCNKDEKLIKNNIEKLFDTYYSEELHIDKIHTLLQKCKII